ncbi:MAG: sigma-54-dependent transcriptional regulator [Planctomycetota bacterium]
MKVLIADDEASILKTLSDALGDAGHAVEGVASAEDALAALESDRFDCLVTDIRLPGMSGIELLRKAKALYPELYVIVITGHGSIESAVEAMKAGATEYVTKPFLNEDVVIRLERIRRELQLTEEVQRLKGELSTRYKFENLVGASDVMQELFKKIRTIAKNDYDVLIMGESGTGKELVARAIHHNSPRAKKPFVAVSCAALPETLLEDELFGHEKGAFTDARERRAGRFELAEGGSIFFDDIDDMSPRTQVKLLRVLQERCFERLGGTETVHVDVRAIAATKVDLRGKVETGEFREDLYYRLNVVPIQIRPLRERPEDVPVLVEHFIQTYGGGRSHTLEPVTVEAMASYAWPGNVRELENAVKRALALSSVPGVLPLKYLVPTAHFAPPGAAAPSGPARLKDVVAESEKAHIMNTLNLTGGNRTKAAGILGISRKNLWEKMKAYGLL